MTAEPAPTSEVDLLLRHVVETPEHVQLRYEVAGVGSRGLAAVIDHLFLGGALLGLSILGVVSFHAFGRWATAGVVLLSSTLALGYFTAFETWWHGQTPGKRFTGIRVVRDTGHPAGLGPVLARNLVRLADFFPPPYVSGLLMIFFHPRAQRLGDLAAGTLVVRDRPLEVDTPPEPAVAPSAGALIARLSPAEYQWLASLQARTARLEPAVRSALIATLVARLSPRFPDRSADNVTFLNALFAEERAARMGGGGGAGERAASRLSARQAPRWQAFDLLATRATTRGLDTFRAADLPDFAARYREVTADLARARTYHASPALLDRIERLAAAGHNALYRDPARAWGRLTEFIFRRCPATVVRSWRTVGLGLILLFGPAAAGWFAMREHPALAQEILPEVMLERAASAKTRMAAGLSYYEEAAADRPIAAASIISNNVRVSIACFAGGIFFGVGSLLLLALNGASLGATAAHFANLGVLGYLGSFIAGHGILELFAIAVAGAAGFRLGLAFVAPGDHTRGDALVLAGRVALPMVGATVTLLLMAGTIEGLMSASDAGLGTRLGISAASALLLLLYLFNGWRHRGDAGAA
jgi:uncharacterized membrane protein SpoIIM required for sporulation/uncharacterized RDD family membrane protein YckC